MVIITRCTDIGNWSAIKWAIHSLALNPGDEVTILAVLHINPRSFPLQAAKYIGNKLKGEGSKLSRSAKEIVGEEVQRRMDQCNGNVDFQNLRQHYEMQEQVKVRVEVKAGSSRKAAAARAAKKLGATWVILDREMKKDKQYFLDRLSCGISSMKSNNTIVQLRGPILEHVKYDEMIPSYSWEELSPSSQRDLLENYQMLASNSGYLERPATRSQQTANSSPSTRRAVGEEIYPYHIPEGLENDKNESYNITYSPNEQQKHPIAEDNGIESGNAEEEFEVTCSVCNNKRPKFVLQKDFSYQELYEATRGFSGENFLSEGGFGFVFEGKLRNGLKIAVKQLKSASLQGEKEFKSEVDVLSQARHPHLVMLLGSCSEGSHRLLVYEYVCNGSLEKHLPAKSSTPLSWEKRIKIALSAARGLEYLHARNIIHRDMRPNNILVTHEYESLLGDFGLARVRNDDGNHSSENSLVGTLGYVAPEYAEKGMMSAKTDVYSFGVVLLQLITGLGTTDEIPEGRSLVGWARPLLETKNYPDLIDKRMVDSHDVHQLYWMVEVANRCLKQDPEERCRMVEVVHALDAIKENKTIHLRDIYQAELDSNTAMTESHGQEEDSDK